MALALYDRVQQTGTANTTVSFTLSGSVAGYQSFSVIGNGNTTYYSATDASGNWEVGIGTYSTTGPTLTRTTILSSSNSGSAVTFSGTVTVFVTYPASKSTNLDASGNVNALGTVASGTWQATTIATAYGGTGTTSSTSTVAGSNVLRDSNVNISGNNYFAGSATVTAAAGTTTLTAASGFIQVLNGTGGQTFKLPDATTLPISAQFQFNNNATGTLTIVNNASGAVGTVSAGGAVNIVLLSNGTVAGTWDVHGYFPENVTWGTNALALSTTVITGGTWNGGTIPTGYGGTGLTTFTSGGAIYATSTSALTTGTLPVTAGGTGLTAVNAGYIPFGSSSSALASSANFNYDAANIRVGIGVTAPGVALDISGTMRTTSQSITSSATITPTAGTANQYDITALAVGATFLAPSGTPIDGQKLVIRIKDNGTAQTLTWTLTSGAYRGVGGALPATTVAGKVLYLGCIYNSQDVFWDVVAQAQQG